MGERKASGAVAGPTAVDIIRREMRWVAWGFGVVLVAMVGLRLAWGWHEARRRETAINALAALGVDTRMEYVPPKGATRDAVRLLAEISQAATAYSDPKNIPYDSDQDPWAIPVYVAAVKTALRPVIPALDRLEELGKLPPADLGPEWNQSVGKGPVPDVVVDGYALFRALDAAVYLATAEKDWPYLAKLIGYEQELGRRAESAPNLAGNEYFGHGGPIANQMLVVAPRLGEERNLPPEIRACVESFIRQSFGPAPEPGLLVKECLDDWPYYVAALRPVRGWVTGPFEDSALAGVAERLRAWHPIFARRSGEEVGSRPRRLAVERLFVFGGVGRWSREASRQQATSTAAASLAVNLYRSDTGEWPRSLGQLVPKYLPAVPQLEYDTPGPLELVFLNDGKRPVLKTPGDGEPWLSPMSQLRGKKGETGRGTALWTDVSLWKLPPQ
jgi:hypothetical protein